MCVHCAVKRCASEPVACGLATVWSQGGIRVTSGRPAALPAHPAPAARVHDTHTRAVKSRGACGGVVSRASGRDGATGTARRTRRRRPLGPARAASPVGVHAPGLAGRPVDLETRTRLLSSAPGRLTDKILGSFLQQPTQDPTKPYDSRATGGGPVCGLDRTGERSCEPARRAR